MPTTLLSGTQILPTSFANARRCINLIKSWIDENAPTLSREFQAEKAVPNLLRAFFAEASAKLPQMSKLLTMLEKRLDSLLTGVTYDVLDGLMLLPKVIFQEGCMYTNLYCSFLRYLVPHILDVPPEVIAQQITIIEAELFDRIQPWELLDSVRALWSLTKLAEMGQQSYCKGT